LVKWKDSLAGLAKGFRAVFRDDIGEMEIQGREGAMASSFRDDMGKTERNAILVKAKGRGLVSRRHW
jgi:hypothetical protein